MDDTNVCLRGDPGNDQSKEQKTKYLNPQYAEDKKYKKMTAACKNLGTLRNFSSCAYVQTTTFGSMDAHRDVIVSKHQRRCGASAY